jgi:hypothetical protein
MQDPLATAFFNQVMLGHCPMVVCDAEGDTELVGYVPNDASSYAMLHSPNTRERLSFLITLAKYAYAAQDADVPSDL